MVGSYIISDITIYC